jgi:4-amino-4-deoxy-L-arabinose transferase-like glycosyltransferase
MLLRKPLVFWILTIVAINFLIVSQLIQDGMFMDGMLYTCIGKNLSEGLGTFWNLHFDKTTMASFHEQPPLYFGLLAIFYKLFGPGMYTERLFVLVFFILTLVFICRLWQKIFISDSTLSKYTWLPVLFYSTIPVCFWAYPNHAEEVVMCTFAIGAGYYAYKALFLNKHVFLYLILSGVFIFLSSLTKGIQGLFPVTCAAFYWLITKNSLFKKAVLYSGILIGVPAFIYTALILNNHQVYTSFEQYFTNRFVKTFQGVYATTDYRLEIIVRLFTELLPTMIVCLLIWLLSKKYKAKNEQYPESKKKILWLFAIGLSGALPLAITTEQRGFYLLTTLPFFALGISAWIVPRLNTLFANIPEKKMPYKIFSYSVIIFLFISLVFCMMQIGGFKRDKELLDDVYQIGSIVPKGEIMSSDAKTRDNFGIEAYLVRYFYISLETPDKRYHYFLTQKEFSEDVVPGGYKLYPLKTNRLKLYVLP